MPLVCAVRKVLQVVQFLLSVAGTSQTARSAIIGPDTAGWLDWPL